MEEWEVLDSAGNPVGKTVLRGPNALAAGEYHLVVHIWVISDNGKYLIQRRSNTRKLMPGEWAATGGAAVAGEDSFTAAARELYEELGIKRDEGSLYLLKRIKRRNSIVDIWKTKCNADISELKLQESEVAEAKWVTKDHLRTMIKEGKFHDYGRYYWSVVFGEDSDRFRL